MKLLFFKKQRLLNAIILVFSIIVPLYLNHQYFDLVESKTFSLILYLFFAFVIVSIIELFKKNKKLSFSVIEISLLLFAVESLLSSFLSGRFVESFWGISGWGIGSFCILISFLLIICFSSADINENVLFIVLSTVNSLIFALSVFHSMKIDLFNLHKGIYEQQYFSYISTIGNVNWMVGYLCLLLPLFYNKFIKEENKKIKCLFGITTALATSNIILCNSDGIYLGICFYLIFATPFKLKNCKNFKNISLIMMPLGVICLAIKYMPCFYEKYLSLESITRIIVHNNLGIVFIIFGIVALMLRKTELINKRIKIVILIVFEMFLISSLIYAIADMFDSLSSYDYYWGNNRLKLWKTTLESFNRYLPITNKLFGIGPELQAYYYQEISEELNAVFISTHSEPIQIIFTYGYIGFGLYISLIIQSLVLYFKNLDNYDFLVYFCPLAAYFGQSLVNSSNPTNYIVMCIIIIFCLKKNSEKEITVN